MVGPVTRPQDDGGAPRRPEARPDRPTVRKSRTRREAVRF